MDIKILREAGYEEALRGMAYSYFDNQCPPEEWWTPERMEKAAKRSKLLYDKGAGHNKFLRQIMLWVDINAPRYFWSEFDTYKVGTVAQSTSTMHKLAKVEPTHRDFSRTTPMAAVELFRNIWTAHKNKLPLLKASLPEGYLQRRIVTMNYQVLQTIIEQRKDHRLQEWHDLIAEIYRQVEHPELLEEQ